MTEDKSAGATGFALSRSVSHLLHRAQQVAADWFARQAGDDGVTLRQFAVLAAIAEKPGQNQTDLVRATGVDRSTLADMIGRMEKRGWVSRKTAAKDARAKAVTLSSAGRKMLTSALPFALGADDAVLAALPAAKRDAFLKTLESLASVADAAPRAAPQEEPAVRKSAKTDAPKAKAKAKPGPKPKAKVASEGKAVAKADAKPVKAKPAPKPVAVRRGPKPAAGKVEQKAAAPKPVPAKPKKTGKGKK